MARHVSSTLELSVFSCTSACHSLWSHKSEAAICRPGRICNLGKFGTLTIPSSSPVSIGQSIGCTTPFISYNIILSSDNGVGMRTEPEDAHSYSCWTTLEPLLLTRRPVDGDETCRRRRGDASTSAMCWQVSLTILKVRTARRLTSRIIGPDVFGIAFRYRLLWNGTRPRCGPREEVQGVTRQALSIVTDRAENRPHELSLRLRLMASESGVRTRRGVFCLRLR